MMSLDTLVSLAILAVLLSESPKAAAAAAAVVATSWRNSGGPGGASAGSWLVWVISLHSAGVLGLAACLVLILMDGTPTSPLPYVGSVPSVFLLSISFLLVACLSREVSECVLPLTGNGMHSRGHVLATLQYSILASSYLSIVVAIAAAAFG